MRCGTETDHGRSVQHLRGIRKRLRHRHIDAVQKISVFVPADRGKMHDSIAGCEKRFHPLRLTKPFPLKRDLFQLFRNHDPPAEMASDKTRSSGYADPNRFHL